MCQQSPAECMTVLRTGISLNPRLFFQSSFFGEGKLSGKRCYSSPKPNIEAFEQKLFTLLATVQHPSWRRTLKMEWIATLENVRMKLIGGSSMSHCTCMAGACLSPGTSACMACIWTRSMAKFMDCCIIFLYEKFRMQLILMIRVK